ncbi:diguanylate cyclase domain-containing protein [Streptomyces sp. NPDC059740]|uniref:diguanylate cyclase domain-containing protein n=1 Tax=Streptomyces sp. NPDC059740 TaxID=3346926 RepID=UPI003659AD49
METESEPYVRLAALRQLHKVIADLNTARSLPDTVQAVADGAVRGLGYEMAAVNLVRPDGDLVVAALAGDKNAEALMAGRVGSRAAWDRRLKMGERWGDLRFVPHTEGWVLDDDDVPQWRQAGPEPRFPDEWHPDDRLFAPLHEPAPGGELLGVLSVDRPASWRRPGPWAQEALSTYAHQAAIAITNARLRSNMQRALVRLEREQQALRASEESFRQAFEYAPSGMAITELDGVEHGRLLRTNDALCRLLGRPAGSIQRLSFADLVHPDDLEALDRTAAEGGRAELRMVRRDGSLVWVSMRHSVIVDTGDGPLFLLTHVEDIEERKRHELQLAHRASHDALTGLPNGAELRARLSARICSRLPEEDPVGAEGHSPGDPLTASGALPHPSGPATPAATTAGSDPGHGHSDRHPGADGLPEPSEPWSEAFADRSGRYGGEVPAWALGEDGLPAFLGGRHRAPGPSGVPAGSATGHRGTPAYPGAAFGADPTASPFPPATGSGHEHAHVVAPSKGPASDGAKGLAVLFCDLDGFKSINDRFGHHTGDAVLIEVARRLTGGVRDGDTVARLGGDEFVVLADGLGPGEAEDLAARLRNAITPPIRVDGRAVRVGASFGIGWATCGMSAEAVLESADQRMYVEKRRSKMSRGVG